MWSDLAILFVLAIPIACVTWTVTHEELFREPREWCLARSHGCRTLGARKFFYALTCEYCFSHYVALFFLLLTGWTILFDGLRGVLVTWFSLVWIANIYMSLFGRLRLEIKEERLEIAAVERSTAIAEEAGTPRRVGERQEPNRRQSA